VSEAVRRSLVGRPSAGSTTRLPRLDYEATYDTW
jgi:hypothetical protein